MKGIGGFCVWEMRGTVLSCVKKVPKNLRFGLEVGCFLCRGSWLKKGLESAVRASSPPASKPLFQFASQTRGAVLRGLPLWCLVHLCRRFFCGKNEREDTPLRRRDSEARSFRRSETAILRERYHTILRQARTAVPSGRAKRAEKESGDHRIELARIRGIHSLFR